MKRYLILLAGIISFWTALIQAKSIERGSLTLVEDQTPESKAYLCIIGKGELVNRVHIKITLKTGEMNVVMHKDEATISGLSTITKEMKSGETHYYLVNGYKPFPYQFSLTLSRDNERASLSIVDGALELLCETKD